MKQQTETMQLTLPKVMELEEKRCPIQVLSANGFDIRISKDGLDKLRKKDKTIKAEKREAARMKFVQKRMRTEKESDISGEDFYTAKHALLKKLFEAKE